MNNCHPSFLNFLSSTTLRVLAQYMAYYSSMLCTKSDSGYSGLLYF